MPENDIESRINQFKLKMIGEGSYANVYKYKDDFYNCYFAYKKMKKATDSKEQERFKNEYNLLSKYNHPNIVKSYRYLENKNAYIMEYCDYTLKKYIEEKGNKISLEARQNVALQFLNAIKIIHEDKILHRDISYNNILIKIYDNKLPIVKISDFGLVKDKNLELTSTGSNMKGTIIDDTLEYFKDYNLKNEIYAIGVILYFIFTGKRNLNFKQDDAISKIVRKCVDRNHNIRYDSIEEIIDDVTNIIENNEINKSLKPNIRLNSNIIDNNGLNELSIEILKNAVESDGNIFYLKTLSGIRIQCGNKSYVPNNPREEAELDNVIELLENNEYIKATSYKKDFFKVTKKGYDYFDALVIYV